MILTGLFVNDHTLFLERKVLFRAPTNSGDVA